MNEKMNRFLMELNQEIKATIEILKQVPIDKFDWQPHEKSMKLGRLAVHVAEIPSWFVTTIETNELDFAKGDFKPFIPKDNNELLEYLDKNYKSAVSCLMKANDAVLSEMWTMRSGEMIFLTLPKEDVIRTWCLNHWYHHRAQLGVYLRLLNIAVPGTYGPSADFS